MKEFLVFRVEANSTLHGSLGTRVAQSRDKAVALSPVFSQATQDWLCKATPGTCVCEPGLSAKESALALRAR